MNELLIFEERLQKPTEDGKNYEPYFATKIAIEDASSIIVTCFNEEDAKESIECLKSLKASNFVLGEEEYSYEKIQSLSPTQFRITGGLIVVIGELVRADCISKELEKSIFQDEKFIQLISSNKSEGKLAAVIKAHAPALWEVLSNSSEERDRLLQELQRDISKNTPRSSSSPGVRVK